MTRRGWMPLFCKHAHTRCVHGDEIIARGFKRVACLDCDRSLDGDLPAFCYSTGEMHLLCRVAPPGWWCSRDVGHDGPCAARPIAPDPTGLEEFVEKVLGLKLTSWQRDILAEHGRRLASERDDLIAAGVDPDDLAVPLHPEGATPKRGQHAD